MKISEMIKNLQEFMDENGDLDCCYFVDDEGNGFEKVHYEPSLRYVNEDNIVYTLEDLEYMEESPSEYTAVCAVN